MMTEKPFAAYEGDQPYFFVSYSHNDTESVYSEMSWIHAAGYNLWYDDGIHVGAVWRRALAEAVLASAGVIFMRTPSSVISEYCSREIHLALDEQLPLITMQLADCELPAELRLSISHRQALVKSAYDHQTYQSKLCASLNSVLMAANQTSNSDHRIEQYSDELLHQRRANRSRRILLSTIVALETVENNDLPAQIIAGGGEVTQVTGNVMVVSFDSSITAINLISELNHVIRAGMSCGDVLYERGLIHGAPVHEAHMLLQAAGEKQVLVVGRIADLAGLEQVSAFTLSAPDQKDLTVFSLSL